MASLGVRDARRADRAHRPARGRRRDRPLEGARGRPHPRPALPRAARGRAAPPGQRAAEPVLDDALDWELLEPAERRARAAASPSGSISTCATSTAASAACSPRRSPSATAPTASPTTRSGDPHAARPARASAAGWRPGVSFTLHGDANDYTGKGLSGGVLAVLPARRRHLRRRGERRHRQHRPLRRDRGARVLPRPGRRALRGAQLRRERRRRGRRRPRLRVHDRRARRRARADGAQLRRRHERRHRLRARRARRVPRRSVNTAMLDRLRASSPRATRSSCAGSSRSTLRRTGSPVARRVLDAWESSLPRFVKVMPDRLQARARRAWPHRGRPRRPRRAPGVDRRRRASSRRRRGVAHGRAGRLPEDRSGQLRQPRSARARGRLPGVHRAPVATRSCASRARAAWSAASRSATTAARWAT